MTLRARFVGATVALSLLGAPAAHAADTFADAALGSDVNTCTSAASPCATIGTAIAKSGNGDTIRVGPGIYAEQVELGGGRSLRATGTPASTVIDGPASPAVDVTSGAGTIQGFTIRGDGSSANGVMRVQSPATVAGNIFDETDNAGATPLDLLIVAGAGSPTITENTFRDDGVGRTTAISSLSTDSPAITENHVEGFFNGVAVTGGTPSIARNVLSGTHNVGGAGQGGAISAFTGPQNVNPEITANFIHDAVTDGAGTPDGIQVIDFVSGGAGDTFVGATLRRNRVVGGAVGISSFGTLLPLTLESDLIVGANTFGLFTSETIPGSGDATATNVTFAGNAFDLNLNNTQLTLNSSIVEDAVTGPNPTCAISFSRGPTTSGNACETFQTSADPMFVNSPGDAGPDDFHLQAASTLRNAGDPAAPPGDALDFDGEPRQNISCLPGAVRRDIGADETIGGGCDRPDVQVDAGPTQGDATAGAPTAGFPSPTFAFSSTAFMPSFGCSVDGGYFVLCTSPRSYLGLAGGSHTFAVQALDPTGTRSDPAATRTWNVDGTPPETQIESGPDAGATSDGSPTFGLGSEAGATFECSLDGSGFASCPSSHDLNGLASGEHRLVARAIDAVGNADPTAPSRTWNVDAEPPETAIDSGPADGSSTGARSATYGFSADEAATFECAADGGAFSPCSSPLTLENLAAGSHTFAVRATDAVGNVDLTPASRSLSVVLGGGDDDSDPPETMIRRVKVKGDDAKVKFTSDEQGSTFRCKLDRKRFKPCRSPRRVKNLDEGKHKIKVQAIDPAGNADPSPAKKRFGVD